MKKKKKKKKNISKSTKSKQKNNICLSRVTAVRVLSLAWNHSPPHLPRIPSIIVLISGPAVGAAHSLIWSHSYVFQPPMSTVIRISVFCFCCCLFVCLWELSMTFYIFHRQRVCLVDSMDLICSLYSWQKGSGSSS